MRIEPIHTETIHASQFELTEFLDAYIKEIEEHEVLVITSKVISLCEGRVVSKQTTDLDTLIALESDYYLPRDRNPYGFGISIKNDTLVSNAGIDESNGNGDFILWPKDPQATANTIRSYLCTRFQRKEVGVIISDSHVLPLRWGAVGTVIGFSGFLPLHDYIDSVDLFGRPFKVTRGGIAEALATAAVVVMGEGSQSTPLAKISEVPFVQFQDRDPLEAELQSLTIHKEADIFSPLLNSVEWKIGKRGK